MAAAAVQTSLKPQTQIPCNWWEFGKNPNISGITVQGYNQTNGVAWPRRSSWAPGRGAAAPARPESRPRGPSMKMNPPPRSRGSAGAGVVRDHRPGLAAPGGQFSRAERIASSAALSELM